MSAEFFIDTNVLVYTFDARSPQKQRAAKELVARALQESAGAISWQVVQEFLNVATQKFQEPMDYYQASQYYLKVLRPLCVIQSAPAIYSLALSVQAETRYSFYDALIIAAALEGGCHTLYTEDMQDQQMVRSLSIENPFR